MLEELQVINHWLVSKDPYFFRKIGIDRSYFVALPEVVEWIEQFCDDTGQTPTLETVAVEFEDFRILKELDPIDYNVNILREQKAYMEYRPILVANSKELKDGNTIEAMYKMKNNIDVLLKKYTGKIGHYDWVKHAIERYYKYMEKHGQEGLSGLTTGIKKLDELTGGWKADDLILLAGRTNEGKSWVGGFFAYVVWRSLQQVKDNTDPVIYITTEMPELEIAYRLDTLKAHFSNRKLNDGKLPDHELYREYLEGLSKSDNSFLIMSQDSNGGNPFKPSDIRAIIESERPAFIVIDQLYDLSDGTGERDIRKKIVNVSNGIRETNLYTQTPIMLLAQAGRESAREAKKDPNAAPELYQIQESDNPAQKATRVITMRKIDDVFKLSLKKNRGGVKDKDVFMRADLDSGIWEESSEDELVF